MLHGQFDHASVELGNIDTHIADGVYLQAIRANVRAAPFGFGGGITLSYGGKIRGVDLIEGDGDFTIVFSDPAVFNFTGALTVLSLVQIGDAYTTYSTDGNLHFGGRLHRTWAPGVSIEAGMSGWVEGDTAWGLEGNGNLCLGACFGATIVTSDAGLAACGRLGIASVGFSYRWATRALQLLGPACDLGRLPDRGRRPGLPRGFRRQGRDAAGGAAGDGVRGEGPRRAAGRDGVAGRAAFASRRRPPPARGRRRRGRWCSRACRTTRPTSSIASPPAGAWKIAAAPGSAPIVSRAERRRACRSRRSRRGSAATGRKRVARVPGQAARGAAGRVRRARRRGLRAAARRRAGRARGDPLHARRRAARAAGGSSRW